MKIIKFIFILLLITLVGCSTIQVRDYWCHCKHPNVHCFYTQDREICYCTICGKYISIRELVPHPKEIK